jgi:hypothetical protein
VEAFSSVAGVNEVDVATPEEAEVNSKELARAVAVRVATTNMTAVEVAVVLALEEVAVSAGRTTISHSEIVTHQSTSSRTGSCLRRLISTVWLS